MKAFVSNIDIHEFFVEGRDAESSQVVLHITEPANEEEYARGFLFMISETNQTSPKTTQILNRWIEEVETGFYDEPLHNRSIATHFEKLLERINKKSGSILRELKSHEEDLHVVIGFINDSTLSFALRGEPMGYVMYQEKKGGYQAINVTQENEETDSEEQLFSDIVSGDIHNGDRVFFATPHIDDGFSKKQITNILTSKAPKKATKHFQHALEDIDNGYSFGGIIIEKFTPTQSPQPKTRKKKKPHESIAAMLSTQRDTEQILAPSLLGKLRNKLEKRVEQTTGNTTGQTKERHSSTKEKIKASSRAAARGTLHKTAHGASVAGRLSGKFLWKTLKWLAISIITIAETIFFVITNVGGRRKEFLDHWKRMSTDTWHAITTRFHKLSGLNKILLSVGVGLVLIFVVSIGVLKHKKTTQIRQAAYQAQIVRIESKFDAAEASLIYDEEDQTRAILDEAQALLDDLRQKSKEEKETTSHLITTLEDLREKIRHAEHVALTELLDVAHHGMEDPREIMLTQELVLITDARQQLLTLERGTQTTEIRDNTPPFSPAFGITTEEDLIFFAGETAAIQWRHREDATTYETAIPGGGQVADALVYNDRLYSLVPEQNQIFKHARHQEGFGTGNPWIKGEADLGQAKSLTVDGFIWILEANGNVRVFERGLEQEFALGSVDPKLEKPDWIWTMFESNWLYFFDKTNARVVVFDKEGTLKVQYVFDTVEALHDVVIDEKAGIGLLIDNTVVKQFSLTHIAN